MILHICHVPMYLKLPIFWFNVAHITVRITEYIIDEILLSNIGINWGQNKHEMNKGSVIYFKNNFKS